jgi:hypothetical protein
MFSFADETDFGGIRGADQANPDPRRRIRERAGLPTQGPGQGRFAQDAAAATRMGREPEKPVGTQEMGRRR